MIKKSIKLVVVLMTMASSVVYAQMVIYPAKGQSAQQQQKDEAECYTWAKGKTGYDPAQATQYAPSPPPPQQDTGGERVRGAARGAVGGAVIGAIAGDTGKGAAIGGVVGTMRGGAKKRQKEASNQQAAAEQQQAVAQQQQYTAEQQNNYQRAYAACFEGRGYTVK